MKLAVLALAIVSSCLGSTVVVWLTTEGIVAAADSLEQSVDKFAASDETVCKIQPLGGYYFAATGYTRMSLEGNGGELLYSARDIAKAVAQESTGMDDFTRKFVIVMKEKLRTAMTTVLKTDRAQFMSNINRKGGALATAVFGVEDGIPKVALISFTPSAINTSQVTIEESILRCPGEASCDPVRGIFAELGIRDFMGPKLEPNPKSMAEAIPWAAGLIGAEIDGDRIRSEKEKITRRVGPPTVILTIDPDGDQWAQGYQGTCPNLSK